MSYGRPYIHLPPEKPFYVTDPSRVRIMCPEKFRYYADRIEDNGPIFKVVFPHSKQTTDQRTLAMLHDPLCAIAPLVDYITRGCTVYTIGTITEAKRKQNESRTQAERKQTKTSGADTISNTGDQKRPFL